MLIVPRTIGLPVAAVPGFGPHEEVSVAAALLELGAAVLLVLEAGADVELLELLLPQAATTRSTTAATQTHKTR